jgi:uncharacterized protein (DUF1697 family)
VANVIFDSKATNIKSLERKIEKHLEKSLGYAVTTFIRSVAEIAEIARYEPFAREELNGDGNTLFVCFVTAAPTREVAKKLLGLASPIDGFSLNQREVYWLYRRNNGESKILWPTFGKSSRLPDDCPKREYDPTNRGEIW